MKYTVYWEYGNGAAYWEDFDSYDEAAELMDELEEEWDLYYLELTEH